MAVMVTGGAGFVGSHVVDKLVAAGCQVIVVDNLSTGTMRNINKGAEFRKCDISEQALEQVFREFQIEQVCHLAAQASVSRASTDPLADATTNIAGSVNLFSLCQKFGTAKVIFCSTAAVYGETPELPAAETSAANPMNYYGLSKLTAEQYLRMFELNSVIFRCSNIYGPRQGNIGESGVITTFIDRILANHAVEIHGDGQQTRDFVYVEDVARAFVLGLLADANGQLINISSGTETSINQVWETLTGIASVKAQPRHCEPRPYDIRFSCLANEKARLLLDWSPQVSLTEGLRRTKDHARSQSGTAS